MLLTSLIVVCVVTQGILVHLNSKKLDTLKKSYEETEKVLKSKYII